MLGSLHEERRALLAVEKLLSSPVLDVFVPLRSALQHAQRVCADAGNATCKEASVRLERYAVMSVCTG